MFRFLYVSWMLTLLVSVVLCTFMLAPERMALDRYFKGKKAVPVNLYERASRASKVIHQLPPGKHVKYQFPSKSGKWTYIYYKGKVLTTPTNDIRLGYIKFRSFNISAGSLYLLLIIVNILFCFSLLTFCVRKSRLKTVNNLVAKNLSRAENSEKQLSAQQYQLTLRAKQLNDANHKISCLSAENREINTKLTTHISTKHRLTLVQKELSGVKQQANEASMTCKVLTENNNALKAEISKLHKKVIAAEEIKKKEFARLEQEFKAFYIAESGKRLKPTIEEMELSEKRLVAQLDKQIEEGRIFGVDFKHERYENILKGRKFEIYIASWLKNNLGFKIQEWSPDKGFEQGIHVEANLNPDLIVTDPNGNYFAIECKYRGKYSVIDNVGESVSWASMQQAYRYKEFKKNREMPVYIALGLCGSAEQPETFFLLPLAPMMSRSKPASFKKNNKDKQYIATRSLLEQLDEKESETFALEEMVW